MSDRTLAERVVARAQSQLGVVEATGQNDGLPSTRYMGGRREPWCAAFCAWCFRMEGRPLPGDVEPSERVANPLHSVREMHRLLSEAGFAVMAPMAGDIIMFVQRMTSDRGPGHHCGIVEAAPLATVSVIEGNAGNRVRRVTYRRAGLDARVLGYARVPDLS